MSLTLDILHHVLPFSDAELLLRLLKSSSILHTACLRELSRRQIFIWYVDSPMNVISDEGIPAKLYVRDDSERLAMRATGNFVDLVSQEIRAGQRKALVTWDTAYIGHMVRNVARQLSLENVVRLNVPLGIAFPFLARKHIVRQDPNTYSYGFWCTEVQFMAACKHASRVDSITDCTASLKDSNARPSS